jgi:hypothetical protein
MFLLLCSPEGLVGALETEHENALDKIKLSEIDLF